MEVLSAFAEVAKEAVIETTESSFPSFFDSIEKSESMDELKKEGRFDAVGKFPKLFDNIESLSVDSDKGVMDLSKQYESNSTFEKDSRIYETDDNGSIYKIDGKMNPEFKYVMNGTTYQTDINGRIICWNGEAGYNPEAERDGEAQIDAGGEDRKQGDDGGHLVARILNGSSGNENIVAMRDTINRGDYKKGENEIVNAKIAGKDVQDSGKLTYDGESARPDKIERTYTIDEVKKELMVDNVEGSKELLNYIKDDIAASDYQSLEDRILDMEDDGVDVSVTSILKEYDSNGILVSVTVGIRDEIFKIKTYIKIEGR